MESIAVMPVPIMCPTIMYIPPTWPISPIPRRCPCVPSGAPEPIVYYRSIYIHRLYYIISAIYILITYYLNRHLVFFIFFHIYRRYILEDVFSQNSLKNDKALIPLTYFHYAQVIYLTISIEIKIAECAVWIIEHCLELLKVLSLCK